MTRTRVYRNGVLEAEGFPAAEISDRLADEQAVVWFSETTTDTAVQRRSFALRKSLVGIRKYLLPMREVVNALVRGELSVVDDRMSPYFQDVYDHLLRAGEQTDALRDLVSTILETRLSLRSNRLDVITKQVTSWAAIIAVPTAVTGFYGQNLPYPGSEQSVGFWTSTAIILVLSVGLYIIFRRKGWL